MAEESNISTSDTGKGIYAVAGVTDPVQLVAPAAAQEADAPHRIMIYSGVHGADQIMARLTFASNPTGPIVKVENANEPPDESALRTATTALRDDIDAWLFSTRESQDDSVCAAREALWAEVKKCGRPASLPEGSTALQQAQAYRLFLVLDDGRTRLAEAAAKANIERRAPVRPFPEITPDQQQFFAEWFAGKGQVPQPPAKPKTKAPAQAKPIWQKPDAKPTPKPAPKRAAGTPPGPAARRRRFRFASVLAVCICVMAILVPLRETLEGYSWVSSHLQTAYTYIRMHVDEFITTYQDEESQQSQISPSEMPRPQGGDADEAKDDVVEPAPFKTAVSIQDRETQQSRKSAPEAPRPQVVDVDGARNVILESVPLDTAVSIRVLLTNAPENAEKIRYSIPDNAGGRFKIDPNSGVVRTASDTLLNHRSAARHDIVIEAVIDDTQRFSRQFTVIVEKDQFDDRLPEIAVRAPRREPGYGFKDCSQCPPMVAIPPGQVRMPSTASTETTVSGNRSRIEAIDRWFAVSKYEITEREWSACVSDGFCPSKSETNDQTSARRPIADVSWTDAQRYIAWLNQQISEPFYRLLSEAEWVYAATAGTGSKYAWGNTVGRNNGNCADCGSKWDRQGPSPIGVFAENGFGLHDMSGNVWEWVQDCIVPAVGNRSGSGESNGEASKCSGHVLLGGSWESKVAELHIGYQLYHSRQFHQPTFGLRVARSFGPDRTPRSDDRALPEPAVKPNSRSNSNADAPEYWVQLAAFTAETSAVEYLKQLRRQAEPAIADLFRTQVEIVEIEDGLSGVRVGPFATRAAAKQACGKLGPVLQNCYIVSPPEQSAPRPD